MARQTGSNRRSKKYTQFTHDGKPSVFTCPDCQGTLFVLHEGQLNRFKCRIGHTYSPESMMEAQDDNVERLMWSATRALEEQSEYISWMADQIAKTANPKGARQYRAKSKSAMDKAEKLRKLLTTDPDCGSSVDHGSRPAK